MCLSISSCMKFEAVTHLGFPPLIFVVPCDYQERQGETSLVAQWLRIRLLMQGTRVQALVWEDPTCHGATKPVHHNY